MTEKFADDGLIVLAANAWNEPADDLTRFVKQHKLKQRVLFDAAEVAKQYHAAGVPTTLWIDPEGTVVATELGFHSAAKLEKKTKELLAAE